MGSKLETKAFTEGFHLRHTNHLSSRAAQHDDMSVIDQRVPAASAKETQGIGQEDLAVEALECRVTLEEQHPRVAQNGGSRLRRSRPSGALPQRKWTRMLP